MTPGTQFHFSSLSDVQWCENWHNCRNAYYLEHELWAEQFAWLSKREQLLWKLSSQWSQARFECHYTFLSSPTFWTWTLSLRPLITPEVSELRGQAGLFWAESGAEPSPLNYSSNKPEKCPALPLARPALSGNWDRREIKQTGIVPWLLQIFRSKTITTSHSRFDAVSL